MPGHGKRCAYRGCGKTTDDKRFGRVRLLTEADQQRYVAWLSPQHSGLVCDAHHKLLQRLLARQGAAPADDHRLDELAAAATAAAAIATVDRYRG